LPLGVAIRGSDDTTGTIGGGSTLGIVRATGFVTIAAAVLPRLLESRADKVGRTDEKAEGRREPLSRSSSPLLRSSPPASQRSSPSGLWQREHSSRRPHWRRPR
jgi:hypothetical protein